MFSKHFRGAAALPFSRSLPIALGLLVALALGCSDHVTAPSELSSEPRERSATSVRVVPSELTLTEGESETLEGTPVDARGQSVPGYTLSWTSSAPSVVTVDGSGTVTVLAEGEVTIEAAAVKGSSTVSGSAQVKGQGAVASVELTTGDFSLAAGYDYTLQVKIENDEGEVVERKVKWSSSDETVASVTDGGVVTALSPGEAVVEARVGNVSDSVSVTVFSEVFSVEVTPEQDTVSEGQAVQLEASVKNGKGQKIKHSVVWSSDDAAVAEVDSTGKVTTLKPGSAYVTATAEGTSKSATSTLTVEEAGPASVEVSPSSLEVAVGDTADFAVTVLDTKGEVMDVAVAWNTTSDSIASVGAGGVVEGTSTGTTSVIASYEGLADTATVTVVDASEVADLDISPDSLDIVEGDTASLTAEATDAHGNVLECTITWTSDDEAVATVDGSGLVTAVAVGTTLVVGGCDGAADSAEVAVRAAQVDESSSDTTSPPPTPSELSLWESGRNDTSVTYSTSWSASDGADSYRWTAGSNAGLWSRSGSGVTDLGVSFTAPRSETDDDSYFCVRAVNEAGESEHRCTGFTVPAAPTDSDGSDDTSGTTDSVFVEDFSTYTSTSDLLDNPRDVFLTSGDANTERISLDTSTGYGASSQSMRYTFPDPADRTGDVCDEVTIRRTLDFRKANVFGAGVKEVWVEVWAKFEDGFDTAWPNRGRAVVTDVLGSFQVGERIEFSTESGSPRLQRVDDNGDGSLLIWWNDVQDPPKDATVTGQSSGASAIILSENLGCTQNSDYKFIFGNVFPNGVQRFAINAGNSLNRSLLVEAPSLSDGPGSRDCYDAVRGTTSSHESQCIFVGPTTLAWGPRNVFDGEWHRYRLHWKLPSVPGSTADGVVEIWIDGFKDTEITNLKTDADQIWGINLGVNHGRPGQEQSLWWGRVMTWNTDPGW